MLFTLQWISTISRISFYPNAPFLWNILVFFFFFSFLCLFHLISFLAFEILLPGLECISISFTIFLYYACEIRGNVLMDFNEKYVHHTWNVLRHISFLWLLLIGLLCQLLWHPWFQASHLSWKPEGHGRKECGFPFVHVWLILSPCNICTKHFLLWWNPRGNYFCVLSCGVVCLLPRVRDQLPNTFVSIHSGTHHPHIQLDQYSSKVFAQNQHLLMTKPDFSPASEAAQSPSSTEQSRNAPTRSMLQMARGLNSNCRPSTNTSELKCVCMNRLRVRNWWIIL